MLQPTLINLIFFSIFIDRGLSIVGSNLSMMLAIYDRPQNKHYFWVDVPTSALNLIHIDEREYVLVWVFAQRTLMAVVMPISI